MDDKLCMTLSELEVRGIPSQLMNVDQEGTKPFKEHSLAFNGTNLGFCGVL